MHPTGPLGLIGITGALSAALATPEVQAALTRGSYELSPAEARAAADRYNREEASRHHQGRSWENRQARRKGTSLLAKARRAKGRI